MKQTFAYIDSLSTAIDASKRTVDVKPLLFLRAIAYCSIQNFDNAIDDLGIYLQIDSVSSLAHWQLMQSSCRLRMPTSIITEVISMPFVAITSVPSMISPVLSHWSRILQRLTIIAA